VQKLSVAFGNQAPSVRYTHCGGDRAWSISFLFLLKKEKETIPKEKEKYPLFLLEK